MHLPHNRSEELFLQKADGHPKGLHVFFEKFQTSGRYVFHRTEIPDPNPEQTNFRGVVRFLYYHNMRKGYLLVGRQGTLPSGM